ncbi:MAG: LCP family protein [Agathobaculum sp.]|uniref:LCP family protein n=2 Tax=Agathobaculum sp. TaxID=2048138 RepID=UPI002A806883|nr:LCP family protein [Agathobaculum sp.]MDY3712694.1 LCP family protein [Agathobaculum sp.]
MEERYERPLQQTAPKTRPAAAKPGSTAARPTVSRPGSTAARPTAPRPGSTAAARAAVAAQALAAQKKRRKRAVIITVSVVLTMLLAVTAGAVWMFVRPPEIKNDPTIMDEENGDKVDVDSLLNSGQRVDDLFTFVIGAVDEDQTRTDALMVATMDVKKKTISVMNIPRDTMCNNGYSGASRKINAAYGMKKGGDIERTKKEIERLMGFKPDKYVIVNFDGIAAIVDAIGGIDYEVPFRMQYDDPSQNLHIDLYAGMQKLNGKQTVEFLRWRHNNDYSVQYPNGDEGRVENQQKFLKALAAEVFQLKNVTKIKALANAVFENVKTDFTAGQILWMGMQAMQIKNENIRFFTLPGYGQMSYAGSDPYRYSFFFPYYQETLDLVNRYFNPFSLPIETLDIVSGPEGGSGGGSSSSGDDDPADNYVWGDTNQSTGDDGGGTDDPEQSNGDGQTTDPGTGGTGETGTTNPGTGGTGETGTTDPGTGGTGGTGTADPGTGGTGETGTTDPGTGGTGGTGTTDPGAAGPSPTPTPPAGGDTASVDPEA